ncbi:hypothetical protein E4T56_gene3474 [Termitomyces sp. T112]|nr:hypothetical protein E4T56_gene3474 [Termitomyces sp. T112]
MTPSENTSQMSYALAAIVPIDIEQNPTASDLMVMALNTTVPTFSDSGATNHCFVHQNAFSDYTPFTIPRQGQAVSKDNLFQIVRSETVRRTVRTENGRAELVFRDALHTPDLLANLVSIGKFDRAGFSVIFAHGKAIFSDPDGRVVLVGKGTRGMYLLDDEAPPPLSTTTLGLLTLRQLIIPGVCDNEPLHQTNQVTEPDLDTETPEVSYPDTEVSAHPKPDGVAQLRRSNHIQGINPPDVQSFMAQDAYTFMALISNAGVGNKLHIPQSYKEAMHRADLWMPAIQNKLDTLREHEVICLVPRNSMPAGKKVIGCRWVFANKYDAEGNVVRRKAQLVVKGYSQVLGEDYEETYAAVVRLEPLHITIALAAVLNLEIWQVDFVAAYLNSVPEFQIFMEVLPGFPGGEGKVVELLKTLYGLMQGGKHWFWTLDAAYKNLGYHTSRANPCV